jgi:hypothetical protein
VKAWLFWDWWHFEHQDNVELCQGRPRWVPEVDYEDPTLTRFGQPRVYWDRQSGRWRMLYRGSNLPYTLLGAESDDGIHWRPLDRPDISPPGGKLAPNHLFAVESASGGAVYVDPIASDGRPFKLLCVQRGGPAVRHASQDRNSYFHEIVKGEGVKPWMAENRVATSEDGLHWRLESDASWTVPGWHPDPPLECFYNPLLGLHTLVTRPGWGDRRIACLTSADGLRWCDLQWVMQPDPMDPPGTEFYGMPASLYEGTFVGLLWMAHFANAEPLGRFNQLWGWIDTQLAYSFDGIHWQRGLRQPFIPTNEPGLPSSGMIFPACVLETGDELRIYSTGTKDLHGRNATVQFDRKGNAPPASLILHTLRKDGFMYLASQGNWAQFITKPLILQKPELRINALAPYGELLFQLTDLESRPLEGYTFAGCIPFKEADSLDWRVGWREGELEDLVGKVVRLEVKFRNARLYAFRGDFHFADALDVAMVADGKPIDTTLFDF